MANVDPIPGQEGVPTNQDKRISNQGDEVAPIAVEGQDNGVDTGSARNSLGESSRQIISFGCVVGASRYAMYRVEVVCVHRRPNM